MSKEHSFKVIQLEGEMQEPNPEDIVGIDKGEEIETSIEYIIGREPTPKELNLLMKYGLADKMAWKDSDIKRAEAIIEFCNADLTFAKNQR